MISEFLVITVLISSFHRFNCSSESIRIPIGIISGTEDDARQNSANFWSFGNSTSIKLILDPVVEENVHLELLPHTRAFCKLLKSGVQVLVSDTNPQLLAYSKRFGIPFLSFSEPFVRGDGTQNPYYVTLLPNPAAAIGDLLKHYKWDSFIFFYDEDNGPAILQSILEVANHEMKVDAIFRVSTGDEVKYVFDRVKSTDHQNQGNAYRILMITSEKVLQRTVAIFSNASDAVLKSSYHFLIVSSNFHGEPYLGKKGSFLITKLSLIDTSKIGFENLVNRWQTLPARRPLYIPGITSSVVMMRDIVEVLQNSISRLATQYVPETKTGLDCLTYEGQPTDGSMLIDSIKSTMLPTGLTGNIKFSSSGEREGYEFDVLEITSSTRKKVGSWSDSTGLKISQKSSEAQKDMPNLQEPVDVQRDFPKPQMWRVTSIPNFRVVSVLTEPYLFYKEGYSKNDTARGNEIYQGYMKDFLDNLMQHYNWSYMLHIVKDGAYGIKRKGVWNGMIGEILRNEADIAVAPLTITSERQEVITFSDPFLRIGLNIVMKKPIHPEISKMGPLFFLKVLSYKVWLLLILAFICFGSISYGFSHYLGEPDRVRSLDTKISDRLSLCSSFWYVLGTLTQRSTGIYPRTIANRVLSTVWGIFCLGVFISYTASVTFIILRSRTEGETTLYSKSSIDVLQNFIDKGYPKIGVVPRGSTWNFFTNSTMGLFKDYGKYLLDHPEIMPANTKEGLQRMRSADENYAMILESPSSQHFVNNKPCDLMVTSGYLDNKAYGVALSKVSYENERLINDAILKLTEMGVLRLLYEKWWHHESTCEDPFLNVLSNIYSNSLTLNEVSGAFYFLILISGFAIAFAGFEYYTRFQRLSGQK